MSNRGKYTFFTRLTFSLSTLAQWDITDTGRLELYDAGNQFLIAFVPGA